MKIIGKVEITYDATMSGPRPARLIITGDGDEISCQAALNRIMELAATDSQQLKQAIALVRSEGLRFLDTDSQKMELADLLYKTGNVLDLEALAAIAAKRKPCKTQKAI